MTTKDPGYDVLFVDGPSVSYIDNPYYETDDYYSRRITPMFQEFVLNESVFLRTVTLWIHSSGPTNKYYPYKVTLARKTSDTAPYWDNGAALYTKRGEAQGNGIYQAFPFVFTVGQRLEAGRYVIGIQYDPDYWDGNNNNDQVPMWGTSKPHVFNYDTYMGSEYILNADEYLYRLCFKLDTGDHSGGDELPLMLTEGNALSLSRSFSSPFSGQLAQGGLTEQDLSTYKARTQDDWSGGRAIEAAPGRTNRYHDASDIDARMREMLVLAPRMIKSTMPSAGPSFLPSDGATSSAAAVMQAYNAAELIDTPQFTENTPGVEPVDHFGFDDENRPRKVRGLYEPSQYVRYRPGDATGQQVSTQRAYLTYTQGQANLIRPDDGWFNGMNEEFTHMVTSTNKVAQSIPISADTGYFWNHPRARHLTHVQLRIRVDVSGGGTATLEIQGDAYPNDWWDVTKGAPNWTVLNTTTFNLPTSGGLQWVTVKLATPFDLVAGTKYWLVLKCTGSTVIAWPVSTIFPYPDDPSTLNIPYGKAEYGNTNWNDYYVGGTKVYRHAGHKLSDGLAFTNPVGRDVAQRFRVGDTNITVTRLDLRLQREAAIPWNGYMAKLELRNHDDVHNRPGDTVLREWDVEETEVATEMRWTEFYMFATELTANTLYWIVLNVGSRQTADGHQQAGLLWECDTLGKYAIGDSYAAYRSRAASTNSAWVELAGVDMYFQIVNNALTKTKIAQQLTMGEDEVTLTHLQLKMRLDADEDWSGAATVSVYVREDDNDAPHATAIMAEGVITKAMLGAAGTINWVAIPLTNTVAPLEAGTPYWITIEANAPTAADKVALTIYNDAAHVYPHGRALLAQYPDDSDPPEYDDWTDPLADVFFILNNGPAAVGTPTTNATRLARQFLVGDDVGGLEVTKISLLVNVNVLTGSPNLTLEIRQDAGNVPDMVSAALVSVEIDPDDLTIGQSWLSAVIPSTLLDASTMYWIVLTPSAVGLANILQAHWYGDLNQIDTGALAMQSAIESDVWGDWEDCMDLYYIINDGDSFNDVVSVHPVVYGGELWLVAGLNVYKFGSGQTWETVATMPGTDAGTSMVEFGGKLYIARGDDEFIRIWDGGNWTNSDQKFTHLLNYNGYLYAVKSTGGAGAFAYYNGEEWVGIDFSTSALKVTGLLGFRSSFLVTTEIGIWTQDSDYVQQIMDYTQQQSDVNGRNPLVWIGDGYAYIPIRNGLLKWDLNSMQSAGPDMDEGLPDGYQGPVSAMVGTPSWLFAAVDAGEGYSGVYAKTADGGGWHRIMAAPFAGKQVQAIAFEAVTHAQGVPRLWAMFGAEAWYVELPDFSNNRYTYTGSEYQPAGHLIGSWWGSELNQIAKDFQQIGIRSSGCRAGCSVAVYIEVDRSGYWMNAGTITRSPYQLLQLKASVFEPKVIAAGSTDQVIMLDTAYNGTTDATDLATMLSVAYRNTSDLAGGMFVRIGAEVGQVADVGSDRITLAMPLQTGAPAAGKKMYGSSPGGREMRYMLQFITDEPTETPRVMSVTLRYQEQILDNARYSMTVRIEDNMRMRDGGEYPYSAAGLRDALDDWITRLTPFDMVLPDGRSKRVKILGANESMYTRDSLPEHSPTLKSQLTLNLIEV